MVRHKIREWAIKFLYYDINTETWVNNPEWPPPIKYIDIIKALLRITSEVRYEWERAQDAEYRRIDTVATGIHAIQEEDSDGQHEGTNQHPGCHPRHVDTSIEQLVKEGGTTTEGDKGDPTTTTTTVTDDDDDEGTDSAATAQTAEDGEVTSETTQTAAAAAVEATEPESEQHSENASEYSLPKKKKRKKKQHTETASLAG